MTASRFSPARLAVLAALSGCLHLAALAMLARTRQVQTPQVVPGRALSVALARTLSGAKPIDDLNPALERPAAASPPRPRPFPSPSRTQATPPPEVVTPAWSAAAKPEASADSDPPRFAAGITGLDMPPRYGVTLPPARQLGYDVEIASAGGAVTTGVASLSVTFPPGKFQVAVNGGPSLADGWDASSSLLSEGELIDGGFAAQWIRASSSATAPLERRINGGLSERAQEVSRAAYGSVIMHDRASMLLQLTAIGLYDAAQLERPLRIALADAAQARIVTFELAGVETISVPYGTMETWHLVQTAVAGQERLEVWLAPTLEWYPVQLKATAPNGAVAIQRLARADFTTTAR